MLKTLLTIDYHKELIETLLKARSGIFGSSLIFPLIFFIAYKDLIPMHLLLVWIVAQIVTFVVRMTISHKVLNALDTIDKKTMNRYLRSYLFTIFANSFLWGLSGILALLYVDELHVFILLILILGIVTAAASTLSSVFHALFINSFTILSMFILSLVFIGATPTYYLVALFSFLYVILTVPSGYKNYVSMNKNIKQKEEIALLNRSLMKNNDVLKEKNSNFQSLLDITMEAIILSDTQHVIIDINQSGVALFKAKDKSTAIGKSILDYVPDYALPRIQAAMKNEIQEPYELDLKDRDGNIFPALISSRDLIIDGEKVRIGTVLDLTQIKQKDKQLIQQSRLAQMGEMISMIAHQWRQPLGAISSTAVNLKVKIALEAFDLETQESKDECNTYFVDKLGKIEGFVQNLTTTIDDFRNFYRPDKESVTMTLEAIITKALGIIKSSLESDGVEILYDYRSQERIEMHDGEMMQVVLNILKNAQDNFREKDIKEPRIMLSTFERSITICDNGGGIAEDVIDKVFDPYFSTKDEKNGTGLGLYMSKTIIEEHHDGTLSVENQKDTHGEVVGVCFSIGLNEEKR